MIFSESGVTPQIPSVAAVRIVLERVTGEHLFRTGVGAEDAREYEFCLANSMPFVMNAMNCATAILGKSESIGNHAPLDRLIATELVAMCLARVPDQRSDVFTLRAELRFELSRLAPWDRHKAAAALVSVLDRPEPVVSDFSYDS